MPLELKELLTEIRHIARKAGDITLEYYQTDLDIEHKHDASPVTIADQKTEEYILQQLRTVTPDIPIIAEEMTEAGEQESLDGDYFWLVDPLDGTKEFLSGNGEFTVNIALIEKDRPVLGVVYAPALDEMYAAAGEGTAIRKDNGLDDVPISVRPFPDIGITVIGSRRHGDPARTESFLKGKNIAEALSRGSSLKFCQIARGKADVYPRFGPTYEWDTAAGDAILRAAGGCTYSTAGDPLKYRKDRFWTPEFIASSKNVF